ncbi:MAG: CRISPR system precrRNA processing endoribonuclease RAMP protein Cas6 [Anaerolineae bacterium]|nr:CRISPR system precrRNA processing endoribonuclease RAMP protein Cas6 [Anaerolineae bacterium]
MLSKLRLLSLHFSLEVLTPATLPPYKGDILRRDLLWHLNKVWCRHPGQCRSGCQDPETCLFGRLLEPPANHVWTESLQRMIGETPPPAYVLWDCQDRRRQFQAGDSLAFELTLIGETAIRQLPGFIAAVLAISERGLGRERVKTRLLQVDALTGGMGNPYPLMLQGVWQGEPLDKVQLGYPCGEDWIASFSVDRDRENIQRFQLHFLSPVKIKMRSEVTQRPDFIAIARAVVRRLRILSQVHGAGEWSRTEWGPLLDLAETVSLEHCETTWLRAKRYSQRGTMPLEGFVGQAWYASSCDLRPLLPVLWLGQWVHIGKAAVWGNGRYAIKI